MARIYSNIAVGTILAGGGIDSEATTLSVVDTTGWPAPTGDDVAVAILDQGSPATLEVITYTGKTSTTLTGVTRGLDGTTARAHAEGVPVTHALSAADVGAAEGVVDATPDTLMQRDGDGRVKVADGVDDDDVATVGQVAKLTDTVSFTSNGSFVKGDYPGLKYIKYRLVGGGGGGGGALGHDSRHRAGGGGGGGGYVEGFATADQLAASVNVTVGSGGSGGAEGVNSGGSGGSTSFLGSTGSGGGGGDRGAGSSAAAITGGSPGGTTLGSRGTFRASGNRGAEGVNMIEPARSGAGGSTLLGQGAPGRIIQDGGVVGGYSALIGYGSGGGGAAQALNSSGASGGDGRTGILIVEVYR